MFITPDMIKVYSRDQLLSLRTTTELPGDEDRMLINAIQPRRGCRAGRHMQARRRRPKPIPMSSLAGNKIPIVISNRELQPAAITVNKASTTRRHLRPVQRTTTSTQRHDAVGLATSLYVINAAALLPVEVPYVSSSLSTVHFVASTSLSCGRRISADGGYHQLSVSTASYCEDTLSGPQWINVAPIAPVSSSFWQPETYLAQVGAPSASPTISATVMSVDGDMTSSVDVRTPSACRSSRSSHSKRHRRHNNIDCLALQRVRSLHHKHCSLNSLPTTFLINASSLAKNNAKQQLATDVDKCDAAIILVTETHFKSKHDHLVSSITGFDCFRRDRLKRKGGGVCIYTKHQLVAQCVFFDSSSPDTNMEFIWVKFRDAIDVVYVCCVYHPPKPLYQSSDLLRIIGILIDEILAYDATAVIVLG